MDPLSLTKEAEIYNGGQTTTLQIVTGENGQSKPER